MAQDPTTAAQVPRLVKVSGVLNDGTGKALIGIVGVTDGQGDAQIQLPRLV
jgi:hypothetical protein